MCPAKPPLPTPLNLPFQSCAGSQISSLISESDVGASVAVTRQKAGVDLKTGGTSSPDFRLGGVNMPAATISATVTVTFGRASSRRPEQECVSASAAEAVHGRMSTREIIKRERLRMALGSQNSEDVTSPD